LGISNVLADIDGVFTFAPKSKATQDPSRVYSGVWFEFNGGHVYRSSGATEATFRHRDIRASDMNCKTATAAIALADAYLARCNTEELRIPVTIEHVPASSVNLARHGQRIPVRFTHIPGFETGAYMAIVRRNVSPEVVGFYALNMELANPVFTGFRPARYLSPSLWSNLGAVSSPTDSPTTGITGQLVAPVIIATGDGVTQTYTLATPYIPSSVRIWVDGLPVAPGHITETDPTTGDIALDFAPAAADPPAPAQQVVASWQVA
jgi:hypothetical protein